jgi:hypothetical protein
MYDSVWNSSGKFPVPKSSKLGVRISIFESVSTETARFNLKLRRFGDLATSLSNEAESTSPLMHAKFKETSEVQESGKQESHLGPRSSTSFSCKFNSLKSLDNKQNDEKSVNTLAKKIKHNKNEYVWINVTDLASKPRKKLCTTKP